MTTFHGGKNAVAAALHRQMQVVDQFGNVAIGLNQRVAEFDRVRGGVANTLDTRHLSDKAQQLGKVDNLALVVFAPIGVHVLAQQVDLAHALGGELSDFGNHIVKGAADFLATGVGHDAEGAVFGGSLP